jgi:hypothetical protein
VGKAFLLVIATGWLCVAGYLLALWAPPFFEYVSDWFGEALSDIEAGPERWRRRREEEAVEEWYMDWVEAELGNPQGADSLDETILRARQQAPRLRALIEREIPRTIACCVKTHRLAALAAGVETISQIALEAECYGMRKKIIGVTGATIVKVEQYALLTEDPRLIRNQIIVRRIHRTCRQCPYLAYSTYDAPPLCESAELARVKEEDVQFHEAES